MSLNVGLIDPRIMGRPMALNLMKGGHKLWAYARRPKTLQPLTAAGATGTGLRVRSTRGVVEPARRAIARQRLLVPVAT